MAQIENSDDSTGRYLEKSWGDGLGRVQKAHAVALERYLYRARSGMLLGQSLHDLVTQDSYLVVTDRRMAA
jgi:hypothetical protein